MEAVDGVVLVVGRGVSSDRAAFAKRTSLVPGGQRPASEHRIFHVFQGWLGARYDNAVMFNAS